MEFLRSFLRCHLAAKPVVTSPNVGCFSQVTKVRVRVTVRHWYFIAKLIKVPDDLIPHLLYVNTL